MPSSALSDALNEYAAQGRHRQPEAALTTQQQQQEQALTLVHPQGQLGYMSPVHDLELGAIEPPLPPPRKASAPGVHAVQELLRVVCATKEAQEIERKRRLAWEQEQEAKFMQRQAEMERQMFDMRQEITSLRAIVKAGSSSGGIASTHQPPGTMQSHPFLITHSQPEHPMSPSLRPIPSTTPSQDSLNVDRVDLHGSVFRPPVTPPDDPHHLVSPSPPPQLYSAVSPGYTHHRFADRQKRHTPSNTDDGNEDGSGSDTESSTASRPAKRINHHDTRCLTIHHAMRRHLVRVMGLDSDKYLPDTHPEGTSLGPGDPVRFIWEKTPKQSVHNGRMKQRVIDDLKANRKLYKHVPDKDFRKAVLESVFDQCFTTFRQKFKAQRDAVAAAATKRREDAKAQKARRLARRKTKLDNRVNARMRDARFEHIIFDGAFQLECMSSEESDSDDGQSSSLLRTRGYPWRSQRLLRLFEVMDQGVRETSASQPKRGVGRKDRILGPPKEGLILPPTGSATWMISKIWLFAVRAQHPDIDNSLKKLVLDPLFDSSVLHPLGDEEEEAQSPGPQSRQVMHPQNSPYYTNSLQYALV